MKTLIPHSPKCQCLGHAFVNEGPLNLATLVWECEDSCPAKSVSLQRADVDEAAIITNKEPALWG